MMDVNTRVVAVLSLMVSCAALFAAAAMPALRAADAVSAPPALTPTLAASKELYQDRCSACHTLPDPIAKGYSREGWQRTVDRMLNKYQASSSIAPNEAAEIVDYLATFAPKAGPDAASPTNPWAASVDDVWRSQPTVTRIYTFSGPGALSGLSPTASGAGAPMPRWTTGSNIDGQTGGKVNVALDSTNADCFALLLDRDDSPRNVDIRTKFQITSGKISPSVGIAFGYTDSSHYYIIRYSQNLDQIALIKISGKVHATLQSTPRLMPVVALSGVPPNVGPAAGQSAIADPSQSSPVIGWHVLRVQIDNGTIRGWIDHNKRITVLDPTYTGGKVGLWSQGDTGASFNSWIIDEYDLEPAS